MRIFKLPIGAAVLVAVAMANTACTSTPMNDGNGQVVGQQSTVGSGAPVTALIPGGAVIKQDKSFTVGNGENWYGKLTLDIGKDEDLAYRFFVKTYPEKGWSLVTTVRSEQTLLVFTKPDRSASVVIVPSSFWHSGTATIVISPSQAR